MFTTGFAIYLPTVENYFWREKESKKERREEEKRRENRRKEKRKTILVKYYCSFSVHPVTPSKDGDIQEG